MIFAEVSSGRFTFVTCPLTDYGERTSAGSHRRLDVLRKASFELWSVGEQRFRDARDFRCWIDRDLCVVTTRQQAEHRCPSKRRLRLPDTCDQT